MRKLKNLSGSPLLMAENTMVGQLLHSAVIGMEQEPYNNKRMSIKHIIGWTYTSYLEGSGAEEELGNILGHFNEIILDRYLKMRIVVSVNDSLFARKVLTAREVQELTDRISKMMNRVIKLKSVPKRFYLSSQNYSFGLTVEHIEIGGLHSIALCSTRYDNRRMIAKFSIDARMENSYGNMIYRPFGTPFYIGKKERSVEAAIREEDKIWTTDDSTLILLDAALGKMLELENMIPTQPYYTRVELFTVKQVLKQFDNGFGFPVDIYNWIQNPSSKNKFTEFSTFDMLSNCIKRYDGKYPLIDFGKKEMDFITTYARNRFANGDGNGKGLNLIPYLKDPSYGDTFRYELLSGSMKYEVLSTYIIDHDNDVARIFLSTDIDDNITIFSCADLEHISDFHSIESFVAVNTSVLLRSPNGVQNLDSILDIIPEEFKNPHDITGFILMVISIYVIIRDRPKRSKMVRCTAVKEHSKSSNTTKKQRNNEKEYVVTRILKTTSDAKEYVSRMTDGYPDREYVLESWQRRGYYRSVRGGGIVWISPTTCHRHLELTKKEIHIKL